MSDQQSEHKPLPAIGDCTKQELYIHVLGELIALYTASGKPVSPDILQRLATLVVFDD